MRGVVLLLGILISLGFQAFSQSIGVVDGQIAIGKVDSVYSDILKENRPFWVHVPASAQDSEKRFPVLYVLDGPAHFYAVTGMIHQLSVANGNAIVPEMIVVAIPNTDRTRDLTPNKVSYFPSSGGANEFADFMGMELIPYIDKNYPTTPYRSIMGHSWGGLFVLNSLLYHNELFNNYIAIDPTIRWDNLSFFKKAKVQMGQADLKGKSLFLGMANRLPMGLNLKTVVNDTLKSSEHMRTILEFKEVCQEAGGLNFQTAFYPKDNHNGVPMIATYEAFRYLFDWYWFDEEILFKEGVTMSVNDLEDMIISHYQNISSHFGYPFLPPESLIDRFADISLSMGQYDKAFAMLNMNLTNYPNSAQAYDAMGDYCRAIKERVKAIEFYEKALGIERIDRIERKLDSLRSEK